MADNINMIQLITRQWNIVYHTLCSEIKQFMQFMQYCVIREVVRKCIHIGLIGIVWFIHIWGVFVVQIILWHSIIIYMICECMRIRQKPVPFISSITSALMRHNESVGIVWAPICFAVGIVLSITLFSIDIALIAIVALIIGDGFAGLIGKLWGKIPLLCGKTLEGFLACMISVLCVLLFMKINVWYAFVLAFIAAIVELMPLRYWDNIVVPIITGYAALFLLS